MIVTPPFEPAMSASVISLWNRCIGPSYPLTERLFVQQVLGDPFAQREGNIVALDGRRVVGWVLSRCLREVPASLSRYRGRASLGALCVDPDYRLRGIGSRLYEQAKRFLAAHGATTISVTRYPGHLTPGIPSEAPDLKAFFHRRGFREWAEACDLRRRLDEYPVEFDAEAEWQPAGEHVNLRPARSDEEAAIMEFLGREFPGGWEYEVARYFESGGDPADCLLAMTTGTIVGFCRTFTPESRLLGGSTHWFPLLGKRWGGLGPIGISAALRGRGLGRTLLRYSVTSLKRRGIEDAVIDWTVLVDFYARVGFTVWKRYWQGRKPLPAPVTTSSLG